MKKQFSRALIAGVLLLGTAGAINAADKDKAGPATAAGQYVDDAAITTKVKTKFAEDKFVRSTSISVETLHGVVTLSGSAQSASEKSRAEDLASAISGVKSVKNDIAVHP